MNQPEPAPPTTAAVPARPAPRPRTPRPHAPTPAVLGALAIAVAAACLLPGGPPGLGFTLVAVISAAVLVAVRRRDGTGVTSRWQWVHGASALLLATAATVRDAPWLVWPDLLAAGALGALALTPHGTCSTVMITLPRLLGRSFPAGAWLARGMRPWLSRGRALGPAVRGLALAAVLLVIFVPLLTSADSRFAALIARLGHLPDPGTLPARALVLAAAAMVAAAAIATVVNPPPAPTVKPATRLLRRRSEWLLPLAALDLLFATFLAASLSGGGFAGGGSAGGDDHSAGQTTYASSLHAGFFQLIAVTALILLVLAAAARWTPMTSGVRIALAIVCALTLVVDASALSRLHAYIGAYGLTRLRIEVGVISLALAAVLVVVVVAGCRRGPQRWVANVVVAVAAVAMLATTAADPDAAIARSGVARGRAVDTGYLSTLSADAVPTLMKLEAPYRDCVLGVLGTRRWEAGWTSANASRHRAARLLASHPSGPCP